MAVSTQYQAIGRRKTSTARVYLRPGTGTVTVNHRPLEQYLPTEIRRKALLAPLDATGTLGQIDELIHVKGGGLSGQADASPLGIARALVRINEALRSPLRQGGYLTRDPRMVERKKPGQPKARKQFQFSKR